MRPSQHFRSLLRMIPLVGLPLFLTPAATHAQICCAAYYFGCASPNCVYCMWDIGQQRMVCATLYSAGACGCGYLSGDDDCDWNVGNCNFAASCITWCSQPGKDQPTHTTNRGERVADSCVPWPWEPPSEATPLPTRLAHVVRVAKRLPAEGITLSGS
jgi:hypothetical protein